MGNFSFNNSGHRPNNIEHTPNNIEYKPNNSEHKSTNIEHTPNKTQYITHILTDYLPNDLIYVIIDYLPFFSKIKSIQLYDKKYTRRPETGGCLILLHTNTFLRWTFYENVRTLVPQTCNYINRWKGGYDFYDVMQISEYVIISRCSQGFDVLDHRNGTLYRTIYKTEYIEQIISPRHIKNNTNHYLILVFESRFEIIDAMTSNSIFNKSFDKSLLTKQIIFENPSDNKLNIKIVTRYVHNFFLVDSSEENVVTMYHDKMIIINITNINIFDKKARLINPIVCLDNGNIVFIRQNVFMTIIDKKKEVLFVLHERLREKSLYQFSYHKIIPLKNDYFVIYYDDAVIIIHAKSKKCVQRISVDKLHSIMEYDNGFATYEDNYVNIYAKNRN